MKYFSFFPPDSFFLLNQSPSLFHYRTPEQPQQCSKNVGTGGQWDVLSQTALLLSRLEASVIIHLNNSAGEPWLWGLLLTPAWQQGREDMHAFSVSCWYLTPTARKRSAKGRVWCYWHMLFLSAEASSLCLLHWTFGGLGLAMIKKLTWHKPSWVTPEKKKSNEIYSRN